MNRARISIVCICCMLAAMLPFSTGGVQAQDVQETLLFEDFTAVTPAFATSTDQEKSAAMPASLRRSGNGYANVAGSYSYVTESEGKRYLEINDNSDTSSKDTAGVEFSIPADKRQASGKLTLTMLINFPESTRHGFMVNTFGTKDGTNVQHMSTSVQKSAIAQNLNDAQNKYSTNLNIAKDLKLELGWTLLTFVLDLDTQTMDTYVGQEKMKTMDFRGKAFGMEGVGVERVQIIGCGNTANPKCLRIDELAVYNYEKLPTAGGTYLINETFENDTVGSAPALGSVSTVAEANRGEGSGIWVTNAETLAGQGDRVPGGKENNTKFVKFSDFSINKANATWHIPFAAQTGKIVVEYDLCIPTAKGENKNNSILTNINGTGQPGRGVALHQWQAKMQNYYNPDGGGTQTNVFSNDGTLKGDIWQHYKIIADYASKRFSIEIDGTLYEDLHLRDNLPANLANLDKLTFAGATIEGAVSYERTMYIDNIKAYDFDNPPPGEGNQPDPGPDPGPDPTPVPEGYLVYEDFQNMTLGQQVTSGTIGKAGGTDASDKTSMTVAKKPGGEFAADDYCMKFSDFSKNKSNSNIVYAFPAQTGKLAVEFDAYKPSPNAGEKGALLLNVNDASSAPGMALYFDTTAIRSYRGGYGSNIPFNENTVAAGLAANVWRSYKFVIDYPSKTFVSYIDGQQAGEILPLRLDSIQNLQQLLIAGCTTDSATEMERTGYFDNIKVYVPVEPKIQSVSVTAADDKVWTDLTNIPPDIKSVDVVFQTGAGVQIDETTLTEDTILFTREDGTAIACTLRYLENTNTLQIVPSAPLEYEAKYRLQLTKIKDSNGMALADAAYALTVCQPDVKATVAWRNASGAITAVKPGELVTAAAALKNNTDKPITVSMILTSYCNDAMAAVRQTQVTIPSGQTLTKELELTMDTQDGVSAAVCFWDAMDTMGWMAQRSFITQLR